MAAEMSEITSEQAEAAWGHRYYFKADGQQQQAKSASDGHLIGWVEQRADGRWYPVGVKAWPGGFQTALEAAAFMDMGLTQMRKLYFELEPEVWG